MFCVCVSVCVGVGLVCTHFCYIYGTYFYLADAGAPVEPLLAVAGAYPTGQFSARHSSNVLMNSTGAFLEHSTFTCGIAMRWSHVVYNTRALYMILYHGCTNNSAVATTVCSNCKRVVDIY